MVKKRDKMKIDTEGTERLKPCPLCGFDLVKIWTRGEKYYAGCLCGIMQDCEFDTEEEAIRYWNKAMGRKDGER